MKILWFTWKDLKNPLSGGAESLNENIAKDLVNRGYEVIFIVAGFKDCKKEEIISGYKVLRLGNKWNVYLIAFFYYMKNLKGWADLVIDEVNTVPFFTKLYVKEKNILLVPQLCRIIWFYEMFFPLNIIGYILEPLYLWLLSDRKVITISESTKKDLLRFGFKEKNIYIVNKIINIETIINPEAIKKYDNPTILSLGSMRKMKRTIDIIKSFELSKKNNNNLKLIVAGDSNSSYGKKVLNIISTSKFKKDITYYGRVSLHKKIELMQKSHIILVTSVKEGWGLIVTEANSQGTPAIVYNIDGLRDSVMDGQTGLICKKNTPNELASNIIQLLSNVLIYQRLRKNCWEYSKNNNFDKIDDNFFEFINNI